MSFDKFTYGNSKAAQYLMDVLNTEECSKYVVTIGVRYNKFMRMLNVFRKSNILCNDVINVIRAYKEKQINGWHKFAKLRNIPPIIDSLYANVITAAFNDFERKYRNVKND